jgi:hypothetical protein
MRWCGDNIRMIELSSTLQILSQMRLLYHLSYRQFWCAEPKSNGDLVGLWNLFSIDELHSINDLGQVAKPRSRRQLDDKVQRLKPDWTRLRLELF